MPSERRQFKRIPMGATVGFQELTFSGIPEPSRSVFRDVSGGGLLLAASRDYPLGTLLKLEVSIPGWGRHQTSFKTPGTQDARPLVAVGQVVRVEQMDSGGFELGIKFLNVDSDDWAALLKFIESAAPADEN